MVFKKGNTLARCNKGKNPWNIGVKGTAYLKHYNGVHPRGFQGHTHTTEARKKMSFPDEKSPHWKGGKEVYYRVKARQVMAQTINRNLKSGEVVHHLDYNIRNNNIDNLHLFSNNGIHKKYHLFLRRSVKEALS